MSPAQAKRHFTRLAGRVRAAASEHVPTALRRVLPRLPPVLLLWLSLVVIRQEVVEALGLTFGQALDVGLVFGWLFDFWGVLVVAIIAQLLAALTRIPARLLWLPVAFVMWFAAAANLFHYQFFQTRLDWWVVSSHWDEIFVLGDSAVQMGERLGVIASAVLLLAGGLVAIFEPRLFARWSPTAPAFGENLRPRRRALAQAAALFVALFCVHRMPAWIGAQATSTVVNGNIVRLWAIEVTSRSVYAGAGTAWGADAAAATADDNAGPARQLALYRDRRLPGATEPAAAEEPIEPLHRVLRLDGERTRALRRRLGLPERGPLHVFLLFLESVRAYELFHPEYGPEIFPETRKLLEQNAITFRTAYTSSFTAGQTVRGQFTTLCSMLPNMRGAATYIAHTSVGARCLQGLLGEHGYLTGWMNTFRSSYHGKRTFELLHGTQRFFEGKDYRARGVTETTGSWGLADIPFLKESVKIFEELAEEGRPVFVHALTISAHHPYREVAQAELSVEMLETLGERTYYRGYLSGLRYEDMAVQTFFDGLFQGPLAERTLVVMAADHGAAVNPLEALTPEQRFELRFRIPIALITKNMPQSQVIERPVHQVDIAPTIARIVGVEGPVTWVGRGLFAEQGSPWVYYENGRVSYRVDDVGCYAVEGKPLRCLDLEGIDPLYEKPTREIPERPELTTFFRDTVDAVFHGVSLNVLMPRSESR